MAFGKSCSKCKGQLVELGECAGVIGYASRLFWWGERNKLGNFSNLTFDGGWSGNTPLGWATDPTYGAGGLRGSSSINGADYEIIGDGVTATRGKYPAGRAGFRRCPAHHPSAGVTRARSRMAYPPLTQGTLHIHLYSASGGINTGPCKSPRRR